MKLPKRIATLLNRKQRYIDSQRDKMEATVLRLQNTLFSDLISEIVPELDIKDGIIQETVKNYKLISILDRTYKDFQTASNQIILTQVVTGTTKIAGLTNEYFNVVGDMPARFDKIVTKANKLINLQIGLEGDKVFKGGWLDTFFNSNTVGLELKEMTSKAVTSNMNMKDYVRMLKNKITGTPDYTGSLERQFNAYAYDLYQQYDSAYNMMLGNELGFEYFIYQGGLIDDSRDFCAAHDGKVWHIDDMKGWATWTPADGEYPPDYEVKAKDIYAVPSYLGYPGYDPGLSRGGYRCRHALGWIGEQLAREMNPDIK